MRANRSIDIIQKLVRHRESGDRKMNTSFNVKEHPALNQVSSVYTPTITAKYGEEFKIGSGFTALAFREKDFLGSMDPLVMVDHYRMTQPTFGAHPHAGLSAVTVLFEDSHGKFHNRDSLGNDFDLMPGDLYWLKAGSGVIHDESPRPEAKIHGLQVFVNQPSRERKSAPTSLHVKAETIPTVKGKGSRVRVVLGESNSVLSQQSPALPITILNGYIESKSFYSHQLKKQENAWIYAVEGVLLVMVGRKQVRLSAGQAIAITDLSPESANEIHLFNPEDLLAHFVLFSAKPVSEVFVQKGPFLMDTEEEIAQVEADYAAGKLGYLK